MRNARGHQGENERQWKKKRTQTYEIPSTICVTRKFHVVVVQKNGKEMYKKVCCMHVQSCFLLIRPINWFFVVAV